MKALAGVVVLVEVKVVVKVAVRLAQKVAQVAHAMDRPLHAEMVRLKEALGVIVKIVRTETLTVHPRIASTTAEIVAMTGRMTEAWTAATIAVLVAMSCHVTLIRS